MEATQSWASLQELEAFFSSLGPENLHWMSRQLKACFQYISSQRVRFVILNLESLQGGKHKRLFNALTEIEIMIYNHNLQDGTMYADTVLLYFASLSPAERVKDIGVILDAVEDLAFYAAL